MAGQGPSVSVDLPPAPPWFDDLPDNARGLRVPVEVGWVHRLPVLSSGRQARATDAGLADYILDVVGDLAKRMVFGIVSR